jgi:hypothetical protein
MKIKNKNGLNNNKVITINPQFDPEVNLSHHHSWTFLVLVGLLLE